MTNTTTEQRRDLPRVIVDEDTRDRVRRAADRAGLSIGAVLRLLIHRSLEDVERGLDRLAPHDLTAIRGRDFKTL